jgi:hypothetical protein
MPHSTLLQLYRGDQFYWRRKPEYPGKTAVSHWQTLSHNFVSCLCGIRTHNISGDMHWLHRYHMITTTMAPRRFKMVWWCLTPPSTIYIGDQFYRGGGGTGGPGKNHWPIASHGQTLPHNIVHLVLIDIRTLNNSGRGFKKIMMNYNT